ncbi:potassium channel family protein [Enteractinococcus coprophilus]|uniref:Trk system potassium uptake protein TrkA n=1 Tax=Enteractinococcus coprophilus TaxID=1027633 RepID=A0A543AM24_9MICC|nr:TrkA family potassium uptake protein [Enteractinococcus coprophilus]TQL73637.1 trk system potassium uptake protein TrkA [Enteractinococcus coprophilus]
MVRRTDSPVLVIGLGRFGSALARELTDLGQEIMALEKDRSIVQHFADAFTSIVQADSTDLAALEQVGADQFDTAVVGIGTSIENSVLTVANLVDLGVKNIWAKAITRSHGEILERIGANHVIYPEQEAGERTAHLLSGTMRNFTELSPDYALAIITVPAVLANRSVSELRLKERYGVTLVAYEADAEFLNISTDTKLPKGTNMLVAGPTDRVDEFAKRL